MKAVVETKEKTQGGIGVFISVIGWLIIALGAVVGVYMGMHGQIVIAEIDKAGFSWTIAAICWIVGIILGLVLIGIGNMIEILVQIANKEYQVKVTDFAMGNDGKYFGNRDGLRREAPVAGNGGAGVEYSGEYRRRRRSE